MQLLSDPLRLLCADFLFSVIDVPKMTQPWWHHHDISLFSPPQPQKAVMNSIQLCSTTAPACFLILVAFSFNDIDGVQLYSVDVTYLREQRLNDWTKCFPAWRGVTGRSACSASYQAAFHFSNGSASYLVNMAKAKTLVQVPNWKNKISLGSFWK